MEGLREESKMPLVIINGPTAVGKSDVAVELAGRINGEIISADSMQVYRGMDIGTAKITKEQMRGIPHHMIDIIGPECEFGVMEFQTRAKACIRDIVSRGRMPIIAGGTGYYIQAVLYDVDFTEYDDELELELKSGLKSKLEDIGAVRMHEYLRSIDPASADIIHPNNTKRLLHAIEYYELTGRPISEHNKEQSEKQSPYDFMYFVINDDRTAVYDRINKRVDRMMDDGLESEVRALLAAGCTQSMQSMLGIGYKEMCDYIYGRVDYDTAVENIKKETRHYAKKQLTWFKREKSVEFIERSDYADNSALADELELRLRNHFETITG